MASKITIKRSLTAAAPAGLSFGEMAFVQGSGLTANQLYVGISGGSPAWVGAQIGTTGTWTDNAAQTSLATQYAIEQRITSKISASTAGVSSFNGVTGAVTGVSSFNGLTGAVSGVTTSVANTFTAVNTFSAGITVSGYLNATSINTTGFVSINNTPATLTTTTAGNATVFNSVATSLGIGGAATAITMGAATGTLNLRNPTIQVGNTVATITTASGTGNTLTISPFGSVVIAPTSTSFSGGSRTSLTITNPDAGAGTVSVSGGNLYLGTATIFDGENSTTSNVNIVFEGATADANQTTLTITEPTVDRTITLPDATGTVALTQTSVASFNGVTGAVTGVASFNGLTGAVSGVTTSVANTFTQLNTFSAGISVTGATFTGLISGATATFSKDITVNTIPIGRGGGDIGFNTGVGVEFLQANTSGTNNAGVGYRTFRQNTTGSDNVAIGYSALNTNTSGSGNVGVGSIALGSNTTGSNKTAIGYAAGYYRGTGIGAGLSTGTGGIYIGYQARGSTLAQINEIVIGVDALGLGSHTAVIGATLQSDATIYGVLNLPSGNITTTTVGTANVFNITATGLNIGGAATAITMGAATGTLNLRNPTIIVGTKVGTITTNVGSTYDLNISPYGSVVIAPINGLAVGGSIPSVTVTNTDQGLGTVSVSGGNLYLGKKQSGDVEELPTPVNIVFEGATADANQTTLTITEPTVDRTITLPDATGTVALTQTSVASFNGVTGAVTGVSSFNGLTGAVSGVTTSVANTFTALQTFSAGISSNGGTFGTPTQLVGTNITGTASGLIAGTVTTNANLTGAITSNGNGTTLGSFTSAHLRNALTDETGTGVAVFGTDPAITTSLTTPSTSFDLLNTTATTVNFAGGASSALNIGNVGGTATFAGSVIVNGDFTVQGNTTTLNTTTLNVEDFNITMGLTLNSASLCTGAGIGIGVGTGITFAYDHGSLGWLSSVNMDLATGKVFKIANASVLSSSALGAGVTGSSLTQVGTITSGIWQGTAIGSAYVTTLNQNTTGSAATVTTAAQPAITSVGILTSLTVSGTLEAGLIDAGTF